MMHTAPYRTILGPSRYPARQYPMRFDSNCHARTHATRVSVRESLRDERRARNSKPTNVAPHKSCHVSRPPCACVRACVRCIYMRHIVLRFSRSSFTQFLCVCARALHTSFTLAGEPAHTHARSPRMRVYLFSYTQTHCEQIITHTHTGNSPALTHTHSHTADTFP